MINNTLDVATLCMLVMDCSTSMRRFGEQPRTELNSLVRTLKVERGALATSLTIYGFNRHPFLLVEGPLVNIAAVGHLPLDRGTRLFGTVADVLTSVLQFHADMSAVGKKVNVLVAVITDGEDNLSPHDLSEVRRLASQARRLGFQLEVFGLGIDGKYLANLMGFSVEGSVSVAATSDGLSHTMHSITSETARLMRLGEKAANPKKQRPN